MKARLTNSVRHVEWQEEDGWRNVEFERSRKSRVYGSVDRLNG